MSPIRIREGFKDQILYVMPLPILSRVENHPLLSALLPTDIGWYPHARYHYCAREEGASEHILILCTQGQGWYEIEGERRPLHAHEALLIPKATPHIYGASISDPWSIHWVHFAGSTGDFYVHQLPDNVYTLSVEPNATAFIEQLFHQCYDSILGSFVLQRLLYMSQTLHHLLGYLLFNNQAFSPSLQTSRFHNLENTLVFLQAHIETKLTLGQMAAHAKLSVSHFSRLFKDQTGYSPMDYFILLKIQEACKQLILTNDTIREISFELGYDDPYYFSRAFKKIIGMSPRAYRRMQPPDRATPMNISALKT